MKETSVMGCQVLKISLEATGQDIQTYTNTNTTSRQPLLLLTPDFAFNKAPFYHYLKAQFGTFSGICLQKMEKQVRRYVALDGCAAGFLISPWEFVSG